MPTSTTAHRWTLALDGELNASTQAPTPASFFTAVQQSSDAPPAVPHPHKRLRDVYSEEEDQQQQQQQQQRQRQDRCISQCAASSSSRVPSLALTACERQAITLFRALQVPQAATTTTGSNAPRTQVDVHARALSRWSRTLALLHHFPHYHTHTADDTVHESDRTNTKAATTHTERSSKQQQKGVHSGVSGIAPRASPAPLLELFLQSDGLSMHPHDSTNSRHSRVSACARAVGSWLAPPLHDCRADAAERDDEAVNGGSRTRGMPLGMLADVALLLVLSGRITHMDEMCDWLMCVTVRLLPACACTSRSGMSCMSGAKSALPNNTVRIVLDDEKGDEAGCLHKKDDDDDAAYAQGAHMSHGCPMYIGYGHCCSAALRMRWRVCEVTTQTVCALQRQVCASSETTVRQSTNVTEETESMHRFRAGAGEGDMHTQWQLFSFVFYQHVLAVLVNSVACLCRDNEVVSLDESHAHADTRCANTPHTRLLSHAYITQEEEVARPRTVPVYVVRHTATIEALLCLCQWLKKHAHVVYASLQDMLHDDEGAHKQGGSSSSMATRTGIAASAKSRICTNSNMYHHTCRGVNMAAMVV